jgi:hypothetical protein
MESTVSFSFSAFRATHATFAPAAASRSAIARPIPRDAPVTIAVRPLKSTCIRRFGSSGIFNHFQFHCATENTEITEDEG